MGKHTFQFQISQEFFDLFKFNQDFTQPEFVVNLNLEKHTTFLDLNFQTQGKVVVDCDITLEPYTQKVENALDLVVKFGHEFDDTDDEVWVIPEGEHEINVAQLIYEMILLGIPNKRLSPKARKNSHEILEKYAPKAEDEKPENHDNSTDPRWESLKKLYKK
ncbi:MAG: DUF177 domain-containing protein [Flavobacteriaceae bacterium]|nr:DUF177 domain-containing protein [Flavobacteriaceae bacterium]